MADTNIETSLAGAIYRNAVMISDPADARRLAQDILADYVVTERLDAQP